MSSSTCIRLAEAADLPALGRLGGMLMRLHHAFDPLRFLAPGASPEDGYAWFLGTQLTVEDAVVLVAEQNGRVIGYVYAGIEPLSWRELRDRAGFIHDLIVDPESRGRGVAPTLINAATEWLRERGVTSVLLWTAVQNEPAQRLFVGLGFRRTMVEMAKELSAPDTVARL